MACRLPPSARLSEQHKAKIAAAHRGRPKGPNHTIPGKKDRNHDEIAAGLRAAGYPIIETNKVGGGAPDIIANRGDTLIFIEIKNPATKYGRKGLRPSQARFKAEWEAFCPYVVVFTLEDAIQAMRG